MKSDKQLQSDVLAELQWEPSVNAAHIGVEVKDGVVTLSGHVDNFAEKWAAERAAKRVRGVRALAIDMDVTLQTGDKRNDSDIARAVINALQWTSTVPGQTIQVAVENGMVTLTGTVDWNYQREAAANSVRILSGVRGVFNQIVVRPRVNLTTVKSDIEHALKRRAFLDSENIQIGLEGDSITLSGKVGSLWEKSLAVQTAWGAPGVRHVVDKLSVA